MKAGELVDCSPAKRNLQSSLVVIRTIVLLLFGDGLLAELLNDFLHRVLYETLEGEDLLRYEAILLKVAVNDLPAVVLIDGVHV